MNVDLDKVRDDLEKVNAEIAETEQMMTSLTAQMALLQGRKTDMETFLRMAEEYEAPGAALPPTERFVSVESPQGRGRPDRPAARARLIVRPITPVAHGAPDHAQPTPVEERSSRLPPSQPMTLKHGNEKRQNKIARRLAEVFEPDETLTAVEAQDKLGTIIDDTKGVTRVHYVSSYLSREADANNGVLERLEMGKYRLRQDAKSRIAERMEIPPKPAEEQMASPSALS